MGAIDVHVVVDGRIKQTWHMEDWASAADQLVNGVPAFSQDNPLPIGLTKGDILTELPQAIKTYYEIHSSPCTYGENRWQNQGQIDAAFHEDWNMRPNPLEFSAEGGGNPGPFPTGLRSIMGS